MRASVRAALASLALLAGPALAAPAALLKLDAATQSRLGVVTAPLTAAFRNTTVSGFARALDPGPLAQLDSDIEAAVAALAASQAEAARTKSLNAADETVSKQAAEAAAAQARADAAKLSLLRRRVGLEWSPALARLSDARRRRLIGDIAAGARRSCGSTPPPACRSSTGRRSSTSARAGRSRPRSLAPAGSAIRGCSRRGSWPWSADPAPSNWERARSPRPRSPSAQAPAAWWIPRAALLRNAGQTFVYIRRDAGQFERRVVPPGLSDPDGLFVSGGFKAGEAVVTQGAAQLFAAQSATAGKDD